MERESDTLLKISLPKEVKHIIDILTQNGYEAYAVGGCVRDSILGRVQGDWDITTSALPQQVKALRSLPIRHTAHCEKGGMAQAVLDAFGGK